MKRFKLKVGIDVDDVLFSCDQYAIDMANAYGNYDPPLSIEELDSWGPSGKRTDVIFDFFKNETFFETQPILKGAQQFIRKLSKISDVYFVTGIAPEFMSIRAKRLIAAFPSVPKENIIMGFQKSLINVDIILDDAPHNILMSNSPYPVLMRRPWNRNVTGCLSVNNYDEFLTLVETIGDSYSQMNLSESNKVFVLVGPSGSGKTELIKAVTAKGIASRLVSYTTRKPRPDETDEDYHFVTEDYFNILKKKMFESTCYAGAYYGSVKDDLDAELIKNNVVIALDICGAISVKHAFGSQAVLVFIDRPKKDLIAAILDRPVSNEEKVSRIISLDDEFRNEELCDAVINNSGTIAEAVDALSNIICEK